MRHPGRILLAQVAAQEIVTLAPARSCTDIDPDVLYKGLAPAWIKWEPVRTRATRASRCSVVGDGGAGDLTAVCGGVIPQDDAGLIDHGIAAIPGPGTNVFHAASANLRCIRQRKKAA